VSAALVWFRRDLRDFDHAALHAALTAHDAVHCAFAFDTEILDPLPRRDRRVEFIWESVRELKASLEAAGGGLHVLHGRAREEIPRLARRLGVAAVFANRDYEPQALARDGAVERELKEAGIALQSRKDQVVFEHGELLTAAGTPFTVFTPYKNAWLKKLSSFFLRAYPVEKYRARLAPAPGATLPSLEALGFERTNLGQLGIGSGMAGGRKGFADFRRRIAAYGERRDFPALKGPSYLSVHLRFGTVSIRELAGYAWREGSEGAAIWLSELAWRDFYFMILAARPDVVDGAFKQEFNALKFDGDERHWQAWCAGSTGYPLVDAAMRQLDRTGYMHNRLRMVTASFLVKDLGIDWRRGERYFARQLNDYDLAANNGGWQWAASTGCDAQPYFRIFNPVTQSERFDPEGKFIRRYAPELARVPRRFIHAPWTMDADQQAASVCRIGRDYPAPIVEHALARKRTLERYAAARRR
jgi:deoxyribodipyrimidine photo-lyase